MSLKFIGELLYFKNEIKKIKNSHPQPQIIELVNQLQQEIEELRELIIAFNNEEKTLKEEEAQK